MSARANLQVWAATSPAGDLLVEQTCDVVPHAVDGTAVGAEATARGAAYLAGLAVGVWSGLPELARIWKLDREFRPAMDPAVRNRLYTGWQKAVTRARAWA